MVHLQTQQTARRHRRSTALAVLGVATLVCVPGCRSTGDETAAAPGTAEPGVRASYQHPRDDASLDPPREPQDDTHGELGVADGRLPDGATVFDDSYPAVARLDPSLLAALRRAAAEAEAGGVTVHVNSGWRSGAYQEHLLDEAVTKYGSRAEAARWVATPAGSAHVSGDAVDVGDLDATTWLSERGATYGLCQIYTNEPWHYELRPGAAGHGCPDMYLDAAHDPRTK